MNRELLAAAAPKWIAVESLPERAKHGLSAMWIEAVMDAIEVDHLEPGHLGDAVLNLRHRRPRRRQSLCRTAANVHHSERAMLSKSLR